MILLPYTKVSAWSNLANGELSGIKKEDIVNDVLYIRRSINSLQEETLGKNENARRYIALSDRAKAELEAQAEWLKKRDRLPLGVPRPRRRTG